ncbi:MULTISPECIES: endonuclease VII domain-containing protein [unclassified Streptomyces]|uniref:endonuclease VII domain-containing protein n=1 Tax=Streptomyces sp. NPDC055082 TaxID=3365718 RepID=UPI0037D63740
MSGKPRAGYRKCTKCEINRAVRFFAPRGRVCSTCRQKARKASSHEARVASTYGLGPGEFQALMDHQGGVCAICRQPRRYRLDVDHDHKTGLVRGLTCRLCNRRLLVGAKDSPETLRSAADYLDDPPAVRFLGPRFHVDTRGVTDE